MPYAPASAQRTILIQVVSLTLSVDRRWQKTGGSVTFSGRLTANGVGIGGETIEIRLFYGGRPTVITAVTAADGSFSVSWTVPFTVYDPVYDTIYSLPSRDWSWVAYNATYAVWSNTVALAVAYNVRIRDFTAPDSAIVGRPFTVSGYLEYESAPDRWVGLEGRTLSIYYNGNWLADFTTGTGGYFSGSATIDVAGTWTLSARFVGEGLPGIVAFFLRLFLPRLVPIAPAVARVALRAL